ncbi:hypothetical protein M3Y94_00073200 [Aphelenchoides besseyi]|nr:hypothetical protein M3Y94_00073200 [Aphelenchoides besseyi]
MFNLWLSEKKTAGQRNSHEYHAHNFAREMRDRTRKEAIKVKPGQSSQLKRIGTTFDQIQRSAITSYSLKKPIGKPNKSRQASNKVITLSESEDEVVVEQPKTPVVEETPSQMTSPIQTAVDVLSIEYLDSQLTPENRVLAPLVTPTVTSTVTPIILPTFEISPTKSLLNELIKMPRFVFYDQLQLSVKFNNLPNDWWLSEEKSGILFVKHQQLEWKGIEMGESFCRFLLSDSSGCVHCFCKPDCKQLAQDFVMSINGQVFSFLKLMDQIVPRFGFQSHLIITTPQDRAVIQHLKTEQFVVL